VDQERNNSFPESIPLAEHVCGKNAHEHSEKNAQNPRSPEESPLRTGIHTTSSYGSAA